MEKIKKAYVGSRFRTRGSNSDSVFKFELKEPLDLPDNTYCLLCRWHRHSSYMENYRTT